jgi:gamma-glutamylaminecyclotransferase
MDAPAAILFFYGSLKRGYSNHHRVASQTYLGDAATVPAYRIIELGQYGGMIRDERNGFAVSGEIWAIDAKCLADLDEFEMGEGRWQRMPVAIAGHDGVQSYCWTGAVPDGVRSGQVWPFDWNES